jgi:hypothetical protein
MTSAVALACSLLVFSQQAEAFRCGSRIIREGMHEGQVRALCGEPIASRQLGPVIRSFYPRFYSVDGISENFIRHGYYTEVMATELVYNFGPRKLIRIIRFEDGYLVDIKTAGYGYLIKE